MVRIGDYGIEERRQLAQSYLKMFGKEMTSARLGLPRFPSTPYLFPLSSLFLPKLFSLLLAGVMRADQQTRL